MYIDHNLACEQFDHIWSIFIHNMSYRQLVLSFYAACVLIRNTIERGRFFVQEQLENVQ